MKKKFKWDDFSEYKSEDLAVLSPELQKLIKTSIELRKKNKTTIETYKKD